MSSALTSLVPRALEPFPPGANATDVLVNGMHYNLTLLRQYNFTLYSNSTLSNGSWCYLTLPQYTDNMPVLYANGSIVNGTSCYIPYYGMGARGSVGIAFGVLFGVSIMLTLVCLRKHGQTFLPQEKRFRAIGRRWPWYWALFVAACGMISGLSAVDVDRYYLPSSPIIIQTLFWYLLIPGLLACVWESVRHWGSWQERQLHDVDPFAMRHDDRRARVEFYLPLVFYLFAWLNFFLAIPRNWLGFQAQADATQVADTAIPTATDPKFRAAAILAFVAWLCIVVSLAHSVHQYRPLAGRRVLGQLRTVPPHFLLTIPLALVTIGYAAAQGWLWTINIGRDDVADGWLYGLGYAPAVLILYLNVFAALHYPNEDLELIRQRIARGRAVDAELGIDRRARKPWWWRRVANEMGLDNDAKLRQLALSGEVGGGPATGRQVERGIELGMLRREEEDEERRREGEEQEGIDRDIFMGDPRSRPFRDEEEEIATVTGSGGSWVESEGFRGLTSTERPGREGRPGLSMGRVDSVRSFGSETTAVSGLERASGLGQAQTVRSMLDI